MNDQKAVEWMKSEWLMKTEWSGIQLNCRSIPLLLSWNQTNSINEAKKLASVISFDLMKAEWNGGNKFILVYVWLFHAAINPIKSTNFRMKTKSRLISGNQFDFVWITEI